MNRKLLRRWLYLLLMVLIFEGIIRKLLPGGPSRAFIFAKDGITVVIALQMLTARLPSRVEPLRMLWFGLLGALVPVLVLTVVKDPLLAIFGLKQYGLFFAVSLAVPTAFLPSSDKPMELYRLGWVLTAVIVPTSALALIQVALPASHWLNLSVGGDDLSAFAAGGKLRVSSTFPFIAQYNFFLTFAAGWVALGINAPAANRLGALWTKLWLVLPAYVVGIFVTGSRQSVLGAIIILTVASVIVVISARGKAIGRFAMMGAAAATALVVAQLLFPDAFVAYAARTGGETFGARSSAEISGRLDHALLGWQYFASRSDVGLFGHGLGIMSNGVQYVSSYAAELRSRYGWGEVDLANTAFEGGYYLVLVWMAFRVMVILYCFSMVMQIRSRLLLIPGALLFGFVLFNGLFGTLGIQPPLYLWWALAVGGIVLFQQTEDRVAAYRRHAKTIAKAGS